MDCSERSFGVLAETLRPYYRKQGKVMILLPAHVPSYINPLTKHKPEKVTIDNIWYPGWFDKSFRIHSIPRCMRTCTMVFETMFG